MRAVVASVVLVLSISACDSAQDDSTTRTLLLTPQEPVYETGPPTVVQLLLRIDNGQFEILGLDGKRDSLLRPLVDEKMPQIVSGESALFEYRISDSAGQFLDSGYFIYPQIAQMEYLDPNRPHTMRTGKSQAVQDQPVSVRIPYSDNMATVHFNKLLPSASEPIKNWKKIPYGQHDVQVTNKKAVR